MLKKTIEYTDYNGSARKEDFYFNISKGELAMMQSSRLGGFQAYLEKIIATQDTVSLMNTFRDLIHMAYGEKSEDGRRFIKSEELSVAFEQTEAYSNLIIEFLNDPNYAAEFFKQILPQDLVEEASKQLPTNVATLTPSN